MNNVLCMGELLLRLSPSPKDARADKNPMLLFVGGAEANVATALAGWNIPVTYCTVLPDNFMSQYVIQYLQRKKIDTSPVLFSGNRIGLYFLETGADIKGGVVYDRDRSSFSELQRGMINWDKIFEGINWFHFTAISPAINESVADVCLEALEAASKKNITISVDLNYRSKLWKYGKQPVEVMPQLVQYCDVIMGNIWSANTLLGTAIDEHIHDKKTKQAYTDHAEATSKEIMHKFPKCKVVANTFRFDSENDHIFYYTTLLINGKAYISNEFTCAGVVDRSGSGDCFMAGLIYGLLTNPDQPQDLLNYATAAAFGKLQEQGDATDQDVLTVKEESKG
jgi:2-dehydro-3-deoxygluconokinase